jgi:hypothetical protein
MSVKLLCWMCGVRFSWCHRSTLELDRQRSRMYPPPNDTDEFDCGQPEWSPRLSTNETRTVGSTGTMAHLPLSRALRTSKNLLNNSISRRAYASASPQLISPTNEISVPPQRTAYEYKPLDEPDPQLDGLGYPRVESVSRQWRNPYAKWDDPQERCNFNEPVTETPYLCWKWEIFYFFVFPGNLLTIIVL